MLRELARMPPRPVGMLRSEERMIGLAGASSAREQGQSAEPSKYLDEVYLPEV
jgi:hypothetical protein